MDTKSSRDIFQYVLLGTFALLAGISIIGIALYKPESDVFVDTTPLVVWGPILRDARAMGDALREIAGEDPSLKTVSYIEKPQASVYGDLVQAVAEGNPPDLLIFESSALLELQSQLQPIPYESLPLRKFRDTYIEGAEIFALQDGVYALPLLVDPLVLYWNRDLFTNALVTQVPKDWETFVSVVPRLSIIDKGADLKQAAVAFGEYDNVLHAREILSALLMQTGNPIVQFDGKRYQSALNTITAGGSDPTLAVRFFTDFSNPRKNVYSWNKSFERSRESFAANKVAMYAGFASEATVLAAINPNLNFDVAMWPQSVRAQNQLTFGKFYGIGIVKNGRNKNKSYAILASLTNPSADALWGKYAGIPVTRRSMLGSIPTDPFAEVLSRSAIIAKTWHMPHSGGAVDDIFSQLINDITSGRADPASALQQASLSLDILLSKYDK